MCDIRALRHLMPLVRGPHITSNPPTDTVPYRPTGLFPTMLTSPLVVTVADDIATWQVLWAQVWVRLPSMVPHPLPDLGEVTETMCWFPHL